MATIVSRPCYKIQHRCQEKEGMCAVTSRFRCLDSIHGRLGKEIINVLLAFFREIDSVSVDSAHKGSINRSAGALCCRPEPALDQTVVLYMVWMQWNLFEFSAVHDIPKFRIKLTYRSLWRATTKAARQLWMPFVSDIFIMSTLK